MTSTPAPDPPRPLRPHKELLTAWLLLLLDTGASYGYELRRELDAHHLVVDPSVLYRALRKLERDGAVQSRWMKSEAGPRRRFYRLTAKGRQELADTSALIAEIRDLNETFVLAHHRALGRRRVAAQAGADATQVDTDEPSASA